MDSATIIKTVRKRWLVLRASLIAAVILLIYAYVHRLLSFRAFGIAVLVLASAGGIAAVILTKKSFTQFAAARPPGTPIDDATRKLLLRRIRRARTTIALMCIALVLALIQIKDFPVLALLVGGTLNLLTTAHELRTIVRLKKILN